MRTAPNDPALHVGWWLAALGVALVAIVALAGLSAEQIQRQAKVPGMSAVASSGSYVVPGTSVRVDQE